MVLNWTRTKSELDEVLLDPTGTGPEAAYWVFSDITSDKWKNMTTITPGLFGKEYPKTYGHYHPHGTLETYKLIEGDGLLLLQKKHVENGVWIPEMVDEVFFVKFEPGEELLIPEEYGHSWTNVGKNPLISFDDWHYGHTPDDYLVVKNLRGMAFYVVNDNGVKFLPNPNYKNLPDPKVVTVAEFMKFSSSQK